MSRNKSHFICQSCGYKSLKMIGKCPECGQWNSMTEEIVREQTAHKPYNRTLEDMRSVTSDSMVDLSEPVNIDDVSIRPVERTSTTIPEFDRVLGGGIVNGSVVLVGGEPGIGKSTLMLQMAAGIDLDVLYVSGEESVRQIRSRAERLSSARHRLKVLSETNLSQIIKLIMSHRPALVIIDSIQTMYREEIESAPGSISQIRECAALLMHVAKSLELSVFLVGHVTKDGSLAGPKVLEHIVDTVLQFEGDAHHLFRILRATKNRFGSTNEIGIFEMQERGLIEVANPSELFLSERHADQSGTVVVPTVEGSRVLLVEVQALVTPSSYGMPQRTVSGFDLRRLQLLIAILEKRAKIPLGHSDVFINIVGGLQVDEPAADLGVVLAIASSYLDVAVDARTAVMGELGLGGEIRAVSFIDRRVKESKKLGFENMIMPSTNMKDIQPANGIRVSGVRRIEEAIQANLKK